MATAATALAAHLKGIDNALTGVGGGGSADSTVDSPGGRLSASSSRAVTTANVTGATSIYYLPYRNDRIPLFDGTNWVLRSFSGSGISASLSGKSANTNYDVFAYWTGSVVDLEIGTAWTDDTHRATTCTITRSNGIHVKDVSGTLDRTRRYLGTIRCVAAGQTEDSNAKRFVWNAENRVWRQSIQIDPTSVWTHDNAAPFERMNGGSADWRHDVVVGLLGDASASRLEVLTANTSVSALAFGIILDSDTNTPAITCEYPGTALALEAGIGCGESITREGHHYFQVVVLRQGTSGACSVYGGRRSSFLNLDCY